MGTSAQGEPESGGSTHRLEESASPRGAQGLEGHVPIGRAQVSLGSVSPETIPGALLSFSSLASVGPSFRPQSGSAQATGSSFESAWIEVIECKAPQVPPIPAL